MKEGLSCMTKKAEESIDKNTYFKELLITISELKTKMDLLEKNQEKIMKAIHLKGKIQWEEIRKVYSLLQDRESQIIFWARVYYSQNRDFSYLYKYLMEADRKGNPNDVISLFREKKENEKKKLIMYGTTPDAYETFHAIKGLGIEIDCVCKEYDVKEFTRIRAKTLIDCWGDVPLITEEELVSKHKDASVFVGVTRDLKAKNHLISKGLKEEQIYLRFTQWEKQYFDEEIMIPKEDEVFVDGGAYDLANTLDFITWCKGKYKNVYVFEPDECNAIKCNEKLIEMGDNKIKLINSALGKKSGWASFNGDFEDSSFVGQGGNKSVRIDSIDEVLDGEKVTFIKLDIEGGELDALKGAKATIKKWKPRLAICIYHKVNDITEIPLYIHGLVPKYKMYIRHYSTCRSETVLYCVI